MSEPDKELRPRGGVGVYIINDKKEILLGLRNSVHASGFWCPPGGHIEYGETFFEAAAKETKEEVDINIYETEIIGVTGDVYPLEKKHYITIHQKALKYDGEAKIMEPDKFSDLKWFPLNSLPENIFPAVKSFLDSNPTCLCDSGKKFKDCCGNK